MDFEIMEDGYPNAGKVVQYYRQLKGYSTAKLAKELKVSNRRIQQMENENSVPDSISRRRALCAILSIPPVLLGLSSSLPNNASTESSGIDLELQRETLPLIWLNYHAGAIDKAVIPHLQKTVDKLKTVETEEAYRLLSGYYRLLSRLYRDKVEYVQAEKTIIQSEKYAKSAKDEYLYVNALLTHGRTLAEVGKLEQAVKYLTTVYNCTQNDNTGTHGTAAIELAMTLARMPDRNTKEIDRLVNSSYLSADMVKDDRSFTALNSGILALYRVDLALQLGNTRNGIEDAFQDASTLMPISHTNRHSLLNVYQAQYSLEVGDLYECIAVATTAYESAIAIGSKYQLKLLKDIARKLATSKYSSNKEVIQYVARFN